MKAHSNHKLSSAKKDQKKKQQEKKKKKRDVKLYSKSISSLWKKKEIQIYIHRSASWDGSS